MGDEDSLEFLDPYLDAFGSGMDIGENLGELINATIETMLGPIETPVYHEMETVATNIRGLSAIDLIAPTADYEAESLVEPAIPPIEVEVIYDNPPSDAPLDLTKGDADRIVNTPVSSGVDSDSEPVAGPSTNLRSRTASQEKNKADVTPDGTSVSNVPVPELETGYESRRVINSNAVRSLYGHKRDIIDPKSQAVIFHHWVDRFQRGKAREHPLRHCHREAKLRRTRRFYVECPDYECYAFNSFYWVSYTHLFDLLQAVNADLPRPDKPSIPNCIKRNFPAFSEFFCFLRKQIIKGHIRSVDVLEIYLPRRDRFVGCEILIRNDESKIEENGAVSEDLFRNFISI